jgi:hypothetical protein
MAKKLRNSKASVRINCALCQSNSPLRDSHIIPEFLYKELYDELHRFHVVPFDASELERFKQKGFYEKLLCEACEQKFSVWEKHAKEAFCEGTGITIKQSGELFKLSNLNYHKFRLFLFSLLWRMDVSSQDFFKLVDLGGKHEKVLRLALLNENPLAPLEYPCLMSIVHNSGKLPFSQLSTQPIHMKSEGKHCHCVVISGMLFQFYVTNHSLPAIFADASINKKGEMRIAINEVQKIPFLAEYVSSLGHVVRSRRQSEEKNI